MVKDPEEVKNKLLEIGERAEIETYVNMPKIPFCLITELPPATLDANGSEYFRLSKYKVSRFSRKNDRKANEKIISAFSSSGYYISLDNCQFDSEENVYITEFIII